MKINGLIYLFMNRNNLGLNSKIIEINKKLLFDDQNSSGLVYEKVAFLMLIELI